jgi:hypothetical protein
MVAKYKHKRHMIENSIDKKPKGYHIEGSERMSAKVDIKKQLGDYHDLMDDSIYDEIEMEKQMELDYWCYLQERNDPNYVCRCFEKKED